MLIRVKVRAGEKKETVVNKSEEQLAVSLVEKAERNLANKRLIEVLAEYYGLPENQIRIIRGHKTPSKIVSVGSNVSNDK